jgi:TPR repeat protein
MIIKAFTRILSAVAVTACLAASSAQAGVVEDTRAAAEQGDASAQSALGPIYANGLGVQQDDALALKWYRRAAGRGNANAQFLLGAWYHFGVGVPQDYVLAHMWFNLAAAQGNANATENRDIVARKMTREQIAEAQRLAREWTLKPE